ncbi:MAG: TraB/GumN family protein [Flavobacteriaceae bacterium]|nr:TraB/GumN family protein [Flavobacteriaceae bacterium]
MKKIIVIALVLLNCIGFAQNNKSLFWEISGNGLTKKSYLYGTMHVNEKVSYHLSDAFFKNLLAADMVGNESDPETWVDIVELMKNNEIAPSYKFYTEFYKEPIKKEVVKTIFETNTNYFNNMLSALDGDTSDFQENTVLDMFIYQTGRKYKKKIVGLEKAKESIIPLLRIKEDEAKPKEENKLLLMKLLKNRNFNDALKEYYREKDVVMLDSIYKLMLSKKAHDVLIKDRNEIMTHSIDSLAKKGSLFSAVGAAHLAGKAGIIELLKAKGYTVTPIFDVFTENGQQQKKVIEQFFPNPNFVVSSTKDGMVKMPLNRNLVEESSNLGSPDFTNGGVTNIKRIPLHYFLKKEDEQFNVKSLDSLFFEKIPGNIIEKRYFEEENYKGYDLKSATKTGNNQHYRFYITPLELIAVSMTGVGTYVRQLENEVFDNIKLKSFNANWEQFSPEKGGFGVEIPSFNTVYGNTVKAINNVEIEAYDNTEKSYYFLTERTLNETSILEDTEYEQKQIHYEFYLQHKADSLATTYDKSTHSFESSSQIGNKKIRLKSFVNGGKYYLLGAVNASAKNTERYFKSFVITPLKYTSKTEMLKDSVSNLAIEIPKKLNEKLFLKLDKDKYKDKNMFSSKNNYYTILSETGQTINVQHYKYSKYESIKSMDSIAKNFKNYFLKYDDEKFDDRIYEDEDDNYASPNSLENYSVYSKKGFSKSSWNKIMQPKEERYEFVSESTAVDKEKNSHTFNALVSRPNATQAIKNKIVLLGDSYFLMETLVAKNYKNDDAFIEKTFQSIAALKKDSTSIFDDKLKLFIEDVKSEKDTIRYSALNSIYQLKIEKSDFETITDFLKSFQFKDNEIESVETLLSKVGDLQDPRVLTFLEEFYKKENTKTAVQLGVLRAISNQKSKEGYKKIIELLEYDLPISDNNFDISSLFFNFERDLENSKVLFPKIFQFYSIPEYNKPIIDFCNSLLDKNLISVKKINSFKKMILTNAKLEYKRLVSWKEKNNATKEDEEEVESNYENDSAPVENFINYLNLINHFPTESATSELLLKAKNLDIEELNIELLRLEIVNNNLSNEAIEASLANSKTSFLTINLLLNKNKKELIKLSDDEIALSAVYNFEDLKETDSINFIEKRIITQNNKQVTYYFYKIEKSVKEGEVAEKLLYTLAFVTEDKKINPLAFKSFSTEVIADEDIMSEKIDTIIKKRLNENHTRASFEKAKDGSERMLYDDY